MLLNEILATLFRILLALDTNCVYRGILGDYPFYGLNFSTITETGCYLDPGTATSWIPNGNICYLSDIIEIFVSQIEVESQKSRSLKTANLQPQTKSRLPLVCWSIWKYCNVL